MKGDFTRLTFEKEKHYKDVRRQQGRVDLDADWNEQADIWAHRTETETRDVIGRCGAPKHDAGFAISPGTGGDFTIGEGRYYVHGILCENEKPVSFTDQPDLPGTNSLQALGRYVVYLDVWQRHITALDDPEIREVALGGPDTATRLKTVWQVKTALVEANTTCASEPPPWAVASTGQLSARAQPDAQSDKPCIVPPGAGYRRLENQLYRVEIHRAGPIWDGQKSTLAAAATFKWSRENGSIAARIASIAGGKITLTTSRKDSALGFAPGQWIEIIDAGLELRGEPGPLAQITAVDDLVLTVDSASVIGTLPGSVNQALLPKVRRWDSDPGAAPVTLPATNNGFLALEDGVEVKFEPGSYGTGDYWMIPARTDHGDIEWPRDSASNPLAKLPQGIRHHFCRLAVIEVAGSNRKVAIKEDCRRLFPPLTELEDSCGCCTKTVGQTGEADYRSIQQAVDSLPDAGGQICILAGTYAESVKIVGKHNITIIGCRERSVLTPGLSQNTEIGPIIQFEKCTNIRLEALFFRQGLNGAVVVLKSSHVTICDCEIAMTNRSSSKPAIFFHGVDGVIERNVITGPHDIVLADEPALQSGMLVSGTATATATVASSSATEFDATGVQSAKASSAAANSAQSAAATIVPLPAPHSASAIQLGGGTRRVRVRDNSISRVSGQGVTLGHLAVATFQSPPATLTAKAVHESEIIYGRWRDPDDRCEDCQGTTNQVPIHPSQNTPRPTHQIISPESLWDIYIERNQIRSAGRDGIGVIGFFDLSKQDEFITVQRLTILGNEITDCLRLAREPIGPGMVESMGYGGIALADVSELVICDNVIERNGVGHDQPVCGIFALHVQGAEIRGNRIIDNGYLPDRVFIFMPNAVRPLGHSGGVVLLYALAPVELGASVGTRDPTTNTIVWSTPLREPTGFPALTFAGNIVKAPVGQALWVMALGPVSVLGNQLTTGHVDFTKADFVFAPATVFIFNLGLSNELYFQSFFSAITSSEGTNPGFDDLRLGQRLAGGSVEVANNQISLDLLEREGRAGVLFTSLLVMSLDDIGFQNNQCICNLGADEDFVLVHALLFGFSLRVTGGRFTESLGRAMYSAMTMGLLNTTAHNQSTHCLLVAGPASLTQDGPNTIFFPTHCRSDMRNTAATFTETKAQS